MKNIKFILTFTIISALFFTGCDQPTKTSNGINIPQERDENAESKVELHNKLASYTHLIGTKSRALYENFGFHQNPTETTKLTPEDLKSQYDEIFTQSEEMRKLANDFKDQSKIFTPFESEYLPQLDILLNSFKELTPQPEDQAKYKTMKEAFDNYYKAHNKFVELLNENIYY